MSPHPLLAAVCAAGLVAVASTAAAREREPDPELPGFEVYRADELPAVRARVPEEIELVRAQGGEPWPEALRGELAARVRSEWPLDRSYGAVFANLGVRLRWPLVTADAGGRVLVPVVESARLPIEGALELPKSSGPRRVVVLVDASASANTATHFASATGPGERVAVLEAERRALDHLVALVGNDWLELGVIGFGETSFAIAEPGASGVELRAALERFRAERPRGEGRTDAVCALWLAREWLDAAPDGVEREIVVLTDGDAPYSGRFEACAHARDASPEAEVACAARRNASVCPARHAFGRGDGESDVVQMASFASRAHGQVRVHALVFEPDRRARPWQQLAARTGGRLVRMPGPEAIELALPALVSSRVTGVRARNATSGAATGELLGADRSGFAGELLLVPGANDVELRVESDRGTAALFRFRVYAEEQRLERWLAELRERNRALVLRAEELGAAPDAGRQPRAPMERVLELTTEPPPAAPASP